MSIKKITPIIIDTRTEFIHHNISVLEKVIKIFNKINPELISKPILYSSIKLSHNYIISEKIDFIKCINDYNKFCINFGSIWNSENGILLCQHDGFPLNHFYWDDNFLNFDYIGAPWPPNPIFKNRVGNGGFSLRSKKFLEVCSDLFKDYPDIPLKYNHPDYLHEDFLACNVYYDEMIERGIKFADVETASKFSIEHPIPEMKNQTFGFHGNFIRR